MQQKITFTDKTLTCTDCGQVFTFRIGEQKYFFSKGLSTPKRCPQCRRHRRETLVRAEAEVTWPLPT